MKKLLALCLTLAMLCSLAACGSSSDTAQDSAAQETAIETTQAEDTSAEVQDSAEQPIDDADGDTDATANDTENVEEDAEGAEDAAIAEEPFVFDASAESAIEADFASAYFKVTQSQVILEITGVDAEIIDEIITEQDSQLILTVDLSLDSDLVIGALNYTRWNDSSVGNDANYFDYGFYSKELGQTEYIEADLQLVEHSAEKVVFGANLPDASTLLLKEFSAEMYAEGGYDFSDVVRATYYIRTNTSESSNSVTF